jgi:hypothetical protein
MPRRWRKYSVQKQENEDIFKVNLLKEESILNLYREIDTWAKEQ